MTSRQEFEDALVEGGFTCTRYDGGVAVWSGDISVPDAAGTRAGTLHNITLRDGFPFDIGPKVRPEHGPPPPQWHMEHDGTLCIFPDSGWPAPRWDELDVVLEKVSGWYEEHYAGWPHDGGDLDLERYFSGSRLVDLVAYDDLGSMIDQRLRVEKTRGPACFVVSPRRSLMARNVNPKRQRQRDNRDVRNDIPWGAAVDLGALERPVNNWEGVAAFLDRDILERIEQLATKRYGILVARYERRLRTRTVEGAAAFQLRQRSDGSQGFVLTPMNIENRVEARRHRSGHDAAFLCSKSVAIIGCGAVGSFLAEQLARSGVGRLTLVDGERLRFGNCVRHLAGTHYVNSFKSTAVKEILVTNGLMPALSIDALECDLSHDSAGRYLADHDLVIDASATHTVFTLLEALSQEDQLTWVSAGVHRAGRVLRVERFGRHTAGLADRPVAISEPDDEGVPESGCGDPVSPTPPSAVIAAASLACRMAIDTLKVRSRRLLPDCIVETLLPHEADAYASVGVVS